MSREVLSKPSLSQDCVRVVFLYKANRHVTNVKRFSLQSIELLRQVVPKAAELSAQEQLVSSKTGSTDSLNSTFPVHQHNLAPSDDPVYRAWFPTLFGLYEVIMSCDLEVRTRALQYLFDTLKAYGPAFSKEFWEVVVKGVVLPIFDDLKPENKDSSKFTNSDDMSIWLSTTLIQALRNFIDLVSLNFEALSFLIDGVLELLSVCMTQGTICFYLLEIRIVN